MGVARSSLDVDLHEIPIGLELGASLGKLSLFLTGGLTLNIEAYDLTSEFAWESSGRTLTVERWRNSGTALRAGGYTGLTARYPLSASGRLYAEASGSYRWVDSTEITAGFASAELDPSSWTGGLGIGFLW